MSLARRALVALVALLALVLTPIGAFAGDREAALAAFERAKAAEERLDLAEAARLYGEAADADPSAPIVGAARERKRWLEDRSEDEYRPLARMLAAFRDPATRTKRDAVEALEAQALARGSGRVRTETLLFCAGAWSGPLGDPDRAIAAIEAVLADPSADPVLRRLALRELISLARARGGNEAVNAALERWRSLASAAQRTQSAREIRRPWLRGAAWSILGVLGGVGIASAVSLRNRGGGQALRRVLDARFVVFAACLGVAGAAIAVSHGAPSAWPFVLLAAFALAIAVLARAWANAPGRLATRPPLRVGVSVAAVAAAGFLSLDLIEPRWLEAFGL